MSALEANESWIPCNSHVTGSVSRITTHRSIKLLSNSAKPRRFRISFTSQPSIANIRCDEKFKFIFIADDRRRPWGAVRFGRESHANLELHAHIIETFPFRFHSSFFYSPESSRCVMQLRTIPNRFVENCARIESITMVATLKRSIAQRDRNWSSHDDSPNCNLKDFLPIFHLLGAFNPSNDVKREVQKKKLFDFQHDGFIVRRNERLALTHNCFHLQRRRQL